MNLRKRIPQHGRFGALASCLLAGGVLACIAGIGTGCDSKPKADKASAVELPPTVQFEVDGRGVQYFFRPHGEDFQSEHRLKDIPLSSRGAVMVYLSDRMTIPGKDDTNIYVADMVDAAPGESIQAERTTREGLAARAHAGHRAHELADLVAFAASEFALLHEDSRRAKASRRARTLMDEVLGTDDGESNGRRKARKPIFDPPGGAGERRAPGGDTADKPTRAPEPSPRPAPGPPGMPTAKVAKDEKAVRNHLSADEVRKLAEQLEKRANQVESGDAGSTTD